MRNPQSEQFKKWQRMAVTGRAFGKDRPVTRLTLSKQTLRQINSDRPGPWRFNLFQPGENEFGTVKSVQMSRSLGSGAATCTIVIYNDYMQHYSYKPQGIDTGIGRPGFLTFNRGDVSPIKQKSIYQQFAGAFPEDERDNAYPTSWGYPNNQATPGSDARNTRQYYYDRLIPNRLLRTYQGYGSDNFDEDGNFISVHEEGYVAPHNDTQLVVTGHWLIDRIQYGTDGLITITCRDLAKVMLEQVVYPPMIPLSRFPLTYCPVKPPSGEKGGISQNLAKGYDASSNDPYFGRNAVLWGHKPSDAFDNHPGSYWLSVGNKDPRGQYAYEWIQTSVQGNTITEVLLSTWGKGYTCYVSVMENGQWQGTDVVPYNPNHPVSHPNGSNIKYVLKTTIGSESEQTIKLPRAFKADKVRVCFTNLQESNLGKNGITKRAGVRELKVRYMKPDTFKQGTAGVPGSISDWSEAVRELCAWAGFTWPTDTDVRSGQPRNSVLPADPLIGTSTGNKQPLRVWGDFEVLGAGPVECTPSDFFLNKSFMECVNTIKDFLGCIFFIDEDGGCQFRFPNLFSGGNFVVDATTAAPNIYLKKSWPIEFHENANLISYSVSIDDSQVRSEILVVGTNPDTNSAAPLAAGVVLGTNPVNGETSAINFTNVLGGQYRLFLVPGSQTAGFKTVEECQRMAELIGLKILHSYRKGSAQILGHPGLQLDDQVRIFERVTNEYNVHYVSGIDSRMDMETGEYVMDVSTNWLGDDPDRDWFLDHVQLTPAVKNIPAILKRIGESAANPPGPGGASNVPGSGNTSGR